MKVLIISHISYDYRDGKILLGGPPLYQIPVFASFNCEIHVVTSTHNPAILPKLDNCHYYNIPTQVSTTFEFSSIKTDNKTNQDDRQLKLISKAENLKQEFIKKNVGAKFDIVILSPIANEIDKRSMIYAGSLSRNSYLDMQGIVRKFDSDGIGFNKLNLDDLEWALKNFDVVKVSQSEFMPAEKFTNPNDSLLVVTKDGYGFDIYTKSYHTLISTKPKKGIIDATGSGDIFLAAFSYYYHSFSLIEAITLADKIARKNLYNIGIPDIDSFT